jgi:hypothetical protein
MPTGERLFKREERLWTMDIELMHSDKTKEIVAKMKVGR